jgi:hypothetical protein
MKLFSPFSRAGATRAVLLTVAAATACLQSSFAVLTVPRDFPLDLTNGDNAANGNQIAKLVSVYRNDVVLLANPEENFAKEIREAVGTPELRDKLRQLASASGSQVTAESLGQAAAALTRQNPENAPIIMAAAMELLAQDPRSISIEDRYAVARGVISGLPDELKNHADLVAAVVGVSARGLKQIATTDLVRRLRDFAINDLPGASGEGLTSTQAGYALNLDAAMVEAGILSPYTATPEFLAMADNFANDQLAETFFSGDQGVINQGAVFAPGAAGSAGGSGGTGNQINPEPPPAS